MSQCWEMLVPSLVASYGCAAVWIWAWLLPLLAISLAYSMSTMLPDLAAVRKCWCLLFLQQTTAPGHGNELGYGLAMKCGCAVLVGGVLRLEFPLTQAG